MGLKALLEARRGGDLDLIGVALTISRIPYGRPSQLSPLGVVQEWKGTCSTKHVLLAAVVEEAWPAEQMALWHRPYLVTRELATARWGSRVATVVPPDGLLDVHTFATLARDDGPVSVDVTFPLGSWDGRSGIPLACGPGEDHPAGDDPLASKARLVQTYCDPGVREPFIAALAASTD
jgi:hypothetical protein